MRVSLQVTILRQMKNFWQLYISRLWRQIIYLWIKASCSGNWFLKRLLSIEESLPNLNKDRITFLLGVNLQGDWLESFVVCFIDRLCAFELRDHHALQSACVTCLTQGLWEVTDDLAPHPRCSLGHVLEKRRNASRLLLHVDKSLAHPLLISVVYPNMDVIFTYPNPPAFLWQGFPV